LLCPFRSIEAWLYQNVDRAMLICRRQHRGDHVHALAAWKANRGDLDELPRPEHEVCLRKEHNLELASHGFPAAVVYDLGKSFTQSVDRMKQCAALGSALVRTVATAAAD
jgi:hypothetical protein